MFIFLKENLAFNSPSKGVMLWKEAISQCSDNANAIYETQSTSTYTELFSSLFLRR